MSAMYETKLYFMEALNYTEPLSYAEWLNIPHEYKSAVLYVQFYPEISLAWEKCKSFYTPEENAVETMMQYLEKNVPILIKEPKRFRPNYIYRVAYNCLYCICHDIKIDRQRWENETSNIVEHDGEQLDLFDTVIRRWSFEDDVDVATFWCTIESMGPEVCKVINHLLNGAPLKKVSPRNKSYKDDPLRDIEVTVEEAERIIEQLKDKLAKYRKVTRDGRYCSISFE